MFRGIREKLGKTKISWKPIPVAIGALWVGALHEYRKEEPTFLLSLYTSIPWKTLSSYWGKLHSYELPTPFRSPLYSLYSHLFGCNLQEVQEPLGSFKNLGEFFYRSLKPGSRPVSQVELVSPSDGKVLHVGKVQDDRIEQVKGVTYSLQGLLGHEPNKQLNYCVIYLAPGDYHRFHSPVDWKVSKLRHFSGELYSVSPFIVKYLKNLFVLNERVVLLGEWQHGFFSMIPVGATNVGSINLDFDDLKTNQPTSIHMTEKDLKVDLKKGEQMGGFKLGSTVILVFEGNYKFAVQPGDAVRQGQSLVVY